MAQDLVVRVIPALLVLLSGRNPSVLGTEVSLGCVRVHDDEEGRLARLPLGTPVEVLA